MPSDDSDFSSQERVIDPGDAIDAVNQFFQATPLQQHGTSGTSTAQGVPQSVPHFAVGQTAGPDLGMAFVGGVALFAGIYKIRDMWGLTPWG